MFGFSGQWAKFWRDTRANVAIIFASGATAMVGAVGGGIDYSRAVSVGSQIQSALDSGVLAAASLTQADDAEAVVRAFIAASFEDRPELVEDLTVTITKQNSAIAKEVNVTASIDVPTTILGVLGVNSLRVVRTAGAMQENTNIEISLVLDISSSMRGSRVTSLRDATSSFMNALLLDEEDEDFVSMSVIPFGGTVRLADHFFDHVDTGLGSTIEFLGYDLNMPADVDDWNGCLEMSANEGRLMNLPDETFKVLPQFTVWNRTNDWCPPDEEAQAVFINNDLTELLAQASKFPDMLSDGTGTDIGIGWGVRALHPTWRGRLGAASEFINRPADFGDEGTGKFLIVMSDGGITSQRRPKNWFEDGESDPHVGTSGTQNYYSKSSAQSNFNYWCDYAKDNGIRVYSIAFQIRNNNDRDVMRNCATSPADFYNVESLDIESAFSSIASKISALRVTY